MPISPERTPSVPIKERPEEIELTPELEEAGVRVVETDFKARVKDKGRDLIQTPQTGVVKIELPADQGKLTSWSKGKITDSLTWFALFWLRAIKKAVHFGWKVVLRDR